MRMPVIIALLAGLLFAAPVKAQEAYPSRPITFVIPFGAGGGTDVIARIIADHMSKSLKTSIAIDNRAGASGQIGAEFVARAKPDGYTLIVGTNSTHSANPYLFKTLRYDPVANFAPVGLMTTNPLALLVQAESPFKTAQDLIDHARKNPGKLNYGYGNTGGQVAGAMLVNLGKIQANAVPYKSTPQIFTDVMGGRVDFTFVDLAASQELVSSGKLRALALTGQERFPAFPNIPLLRDTPGLQDFLLFAWVGLIAPAGTPAPIMERLSTELRNALQTAAVREQLEKMAGSIVVPSKDIPDFVAFLAGQNTLWKQRIGEAGIQPE